MPYLEDVEINKELVLHFFLVFSRFEFALKFAGYARGNENRVEPNWERFADSIRDRFDKNYSPQLAQACDYFLVNPPNQQVWINNSLAWSPNIPVNRSEPELLIALVKRVRNNLFHGGKYHANVHEETARSEDLLRGSVLILEECLRDSPEVRRAYDGATI